MTGYDALRSGEATYYGEALIAAQWLGDAAFIRYATAQGVDVWERLAPYAEERHAGVIERAAAACRAA